MNDEHVLDQVRNYLVDMDGNPLSLRQWGDLYDDMAGRTLASDEFVQPDGEPVIVRTVWSGHNEPEMGTLPFGTGVRRNDRWRDAVEYSSKEDALAGHARIVEALRAGKEIE